MKLLLSTIMTLTLLTLSLVGCGKSPQVEQQEEQVQTKPKVVATTTMITDLVKNIGKEHIEVEGLMPAGVDPHLYKPSAGDVSKMQNADLILYNGLHLEGKIGDVLEQLNQNNKKTLAVTKDIDKKDLIESDEFDESFDPHVWFDVSLWIEVTDTVKNSLIELDQANKEHYEQNAKAYIEKLEKLHQYVLDEVEKVSEEKRILVTAHDAFNYFAKAYNFKVEGLQGISTDVEAGVADVRGLAEFIVEKEIPAIFVESSVPKKNIEALQEAVKSRGFDVEIGGELFSDSLGEKGTEEGTYEGTIKHNVNTIIKNLKDS